MKEKRYTLVFLPNLTAICTLAMPKHCTLTLQLLKKYNGLCNLRMDDTNPTKEDVEYVDAIKEDIAWLGFSWGDRFLLCV